MSDSNNSGGRSGGIGFVGLLTIVFITLKLCGVINWSWWWVLSPIWISAAFVIAVLAFCARLLAMTQARPNSKAETIAIQWMSPDRLPRACEADRYGYVLVAFGRPANPWIRIARFDGQLGAWVDVCNFQMRGILRWAAMPRPNFEAETPSALKVS